MQNKSFSNLKPLNNLFKNLILKSKHQLEMRIENFNFKNKRCVTLDAFWDILAHRLGLEWGLSLARTRDYLGLNLAKACEPLQELDMARYKAEQLIIKSGFQSLFLF